ncbi:MAG: hypothetical protein NZ480_03980 [Bdellovibrionaceae bacterium]|nr:hypothetical protein [Pseudobdellovibrionaceae bacterium]MDW8189997.1 hypothetical protein [Pseudobdellovibrionaceae bacterium]
MGLLRIRSLAYLLLIVVTLLSHYMLLAMVANAQDDFAIYVRTSNIRISRYYTDSKLIYELLLLRKLEDNNFMVLIFPIYHDHPISTWGYYFYARPDGAVEPGSKNKSYVLFKVGWNATQTHLKIEEDCPLGLLTFLGEKKENISLIHGKRDFHCWSQLVISGTLDISDPQQTVFTNITDNTWNLRWHSAERTDLFIESNSRVFWVPSNYGVRDNVLELLSVTTSDKSPQLHFPDGVCRFNKMGHCTYRIERDPANKLFYLTTITGKKTKYIIELLERNRKEWIFVIDPDHIRRKE